MFQKTHTGLNKKVSLEEEDHPWEDKYLFNGSLHSYHFFFFFFALLD